MAGGPEQCSICLDDLDSGAPTLACGHRFHAACLAQMAGAVGTATTRRGALTACPNCRTVSRVAPLAPVVQAFSVGDRVLALWGHRWFPGVVDEVVDGGDAYEIVWDDGDVPRRRRARAGRAERSATRKTQTSSCEVAVGRLELDARVISLLPSHPSLTGFHHAKKK